MGRARRAVCAVVAGVVLLLGAGLASSTSGPPDPLRSSGRASLPIAAVSSRDAAVVAIQSGTRVLVRAASPVAAGMVAAAFAAAVALCLVDLLHRVTRHREGASCALTRGPPAP